VRSGAWEFLSGRVHALLARLPLDANLSRICLANRLRKLIRLDFVGAEIGDIIVPDMELPLSNVPAVLALRIVSITLQFLR